MTTYDKDAEPLPQQTAAEHRVPSGSRRWLALGGLGVAVALVAGAIGWWIGSSAEATDAPAIVEEWEQAWISGDPDAVAALYADDATWQDSTSPGDVLEGRDRIRSNAEFTLSWIDFGEFERESVVVGDGVIVVESEWKGDSRAEDRMSMTPFDAPAVSVFEVEDGLITSSTLYFDPDDVFT